MDAFDAWFDIMIQVEGYDLSLDPTDPGNYTPAGILRGSRYGLSALRYPDLDFTNLTKERAAAIAQRDYWYAHDLDAYPPPFALLMADAYYNGADSPVKWLQSAVGVTQDGDAGPVTLGAAVKVASEPNAMVTALGEFAARHLAYHAHLDRPPDELGWARRDVIVLLEAIRWAGGLPATNL